MIVAGVNWALPPSAHLYLQFLEFSKRSHGGLRGYLCEGVGRVLKKGRSLGDTRPDFPLHCHVPQLLSHTVPLARIAGAVAFRALNKVLTSCGGGRSLGERLLVLRR